jgi:hypothetical protein
MPPADHFDFFLSRRGSIASVAREVCDVLTAKGYTVFVQHYDIPLGDSFIEAMQEAIKSWHGCPRQHRGRDEQPELIGE